MSVFLKDIEATILSWPSNPLFQIGFIVFAVFGLWKASQDILAHSAGLHDAAKVERLEAVAENAKAIKPLAEVLVQTALIVRMMNVANRISGARLKIEQYEASQQRGYPQEVMPNTDRRNPEAQSLWDYIAAISEGLEQFPAWNAQPRLPEWTLTQPQVGSRILGAQFFDPALNVDYFAQHAANILDMKKRLDVLSSSCFKAQQVAKSAIEQTIGLMR